MAELIGHWKNIEEAQKLTQSQLIPGVIEEDFKRGNLIGDPRVPVALALGKSILWNRESTVVEASGIAIGGQTSWADDVEYERVETELKEFYIQRKLTNFIKDVYGTINNYEAQMLLEMKKGMVRTMGDSLVYDDITYGGVLQIDGLHALAAIQTGSNLDIDQEEAGLSLHNMRLMEDEMVHGIDMWWMPYPIWRRIAEAYQERGLVQLASGTAGTLSYISIGTNDIGKRVFYFNGVPLVPTDYLVAEQANTGVGSDARAKYVDDLQYSIFAIKFGDVFNGEPGLGLGFGNPEMTGQMYVLETFDKLENFIAKGFRLYTHFSTLLGSKLCLGRIYDIEDLAVVA